MSFLDVTLYLLDGFKISLLIFAVTLLCGAPLGLPIAFCTMSRFKPIQYLAKVFVWIVRGVPLMLQIFIIYYVPGLLFNYNLFSKIDRFMLFEIYRGGIESISSGQYEAGYVLGLTKSQVFRKIVIMQVIKRIVPPMSNEIITLIKDTALANCIMVCEIIKQAKELAATKAMIWPLFYTGVFYLIFVGLLTIILGKLEKKLDYYKG